MKRSGFKSFVALLSAFAIFFVGFSSVASAGVIATQQVLSAQQADLDRATLQQYLDNEQVSAKLLALGVDRAEVEQRIAAMTDQELAQFNSQLDQLPAGGDVLGIIVLFLIIFIITDIIGATDIFPFVHPVSR